MSTQVFDISFEKIQISFTQMREQAGWDTNSNLIWGYYFLDHDSTKLEGFGNKLKEKGFTIVELRKIDESQLYILHLEETIIHSPESLFEQCHKLAKLAIENNIEVFDGWDVEKESLYKGLPQ